MQAGEGRGEVMLQETGAPLTVGYVLFLRRSLVLGGRQLCD